MASDRLDLDNLPTPAPNPIYHEVARGAVRAVLAHLSGPADFEALESLHPILWEEWRKRLMDHHDAIRNVWPLRYDLELNRLREAGELSVVEWSRRFQSLYCATRTEWAIGGLVSQMCTSVDFWTSPNAIEERTREGAAAIAASELAALAGEIVDVLCGVFQDDDGWVG